MSYNSEGSLRNVDLGYCPHIPKLLLFTLTMFQSYTPGTYIRPSKTCIRLSKTCFRPSRLVSFYCKFSVIGTTQSDRIKKIWGKPVVISNGHHPPKADNNILFGIFNTISSWLNCTSFCQGQLGSLKPQLKLSFIFIPSFSHTHHPTTQESLRSSIAGLCQ